MRPMLNALALGLSLAAGLPAWADMQARDAAGADRSLALAEGLVKKVDKAQGKLTLKHGPLENLGMPGMTMVFRVQDANWLDRVKPGDTIRFLADRVNGVFIVTRLEVAKP
ncbi:copper-binding protein [Thiobacillus sp.]